MAICVCLDELGDLWKVTWPWTRRSQKTLQGDCRLGQLCDWPIASTGFAINVTAERVARASDQTQATAVELAKPLESQAQEIAGVSAAINEMAVSIDQVSSNAAESAAVADRSVAIAYNGAEVVQRTIDGMNTIRDQIQETSKRIKRLGESS